MEQFYESIDDTRETIKNKLRQCYDGKIARVISETCGRYVWPISYYAYIQFHKTFKKQ